MHPLQGLCTPGNPQLHFSQQPPNPTRVTLHIQVKKASPHAETLGARAEPPWQGSPLIGRSPRQSTPARPLAPPRVRQPRPPPEPRNEPQRPRDTLAQARALTHSGAAPTRLLGSGRAGGRLSTLSVRQRT